MRRSIQDALLKQAELIYNDAKAAGLNSSDLADLDKRHKKLNQLIAADAAFCL